MQPDVNRMLTMVRERTGYEVTVTRDETVTTHAAMTTASAASPAHVISLNPRYERTANYMVALQCAMILVKWADPKRIYDIAVSDGLLLDVAQRFSPEPHVSADKKLWLTKSLLLQLASLPAELMAAEHCFKECPGLRDEQRICMTDQLREASMALSPKIRAAAPKAIYDGNAVMSSVLALWWAEVDGSRIALLPYRALGYLKKGDELYADFRSVGVDDAQRLRKVVDLWAARLDLKGCYEWRLRTN